MASLPPPPPPMIPLRRSGPPPAAPTLPTMPQLPTFNHVVPTTKPHHNKETTISPPLPRPHGLPPPAPTLPTLTQIKPPPRPQPSHYRQQPPPSHPVPTSSSSPASRHPPVVNPYPAHAPPLDTFLSVRSDTYFDEDHHIGDDDRHNDYNDDEDHPLDDDGFPARPAFDETFIARGSTAYPIAPPPKPGRPSTVERSVHRPPQPPNTRQPNLHRDQAPGMTFKSQVDAHIHDDEDDDNDEEEEEDSDDDYTQFSHSAHRPPPSPPSATLHPNPPRGMAPNSVAPRPPISAISPRSSSAAVPIPPPPPPRMSTAVVVEPYHSKAPAPPPPPPPRMSTAVPVNPYTKSTGAAAPPRPAALLPGRVSRDTQIGNELHRMDSAVGTLALAPPPPIKAPLTRGRAPNGHPPPLTPTNMSKPIESASRGPAAPIPPPPPPRALNNSIIPSGSAPPPPPLPPNGTHAKRANGVIPPMPPASRAAAPPPPVPSRPVAVQPLEVRERHQQQQNQLEHSEPLRNGRHHAVHSPDSPHHPPFTPQTRPPDKAAMNGGLNGPVRGPYVQVSHSLTPDAQDIAPAQLMALACEQQDWWRILTLASEHGPAVTSVHAGEDRWTALHYAALENKDKYATQLALRCAAPVNAVDVHGDTPLIIAVQNSSTKIVRLLAGEAGANVTIAGRFGLTALHWCSEIENENQACTCAEILLLKGADVGAEDEAGKTPLHWAALSGHERLVALLLMRGGMGVIDRRDTSGRTGLYNAAEKGNAAVVKLLLERGANPAITDSAGATPYEAAKRAGHSSCTKLLRKHKTARHSGPVMTVNRGTFESLDSDSVSESSKSTGRNYQRGTVSDSAVSTNGHAHAIDDGKLSAWDTSSLPGQGHHLPAAYTAGKPAKAKSAGGCSVQ